MISVIFFIYNMCVNTKIGQRNIWSFIERDFIQTINTSSTHYSLNYWLLLSLQSINHNFIPICSYYCKRVTILFYR